MRLDRRRFLQGVGGVAGLWVVGSGCVAPPTYRPTPNGTPFSSGVLSGLHSDTEVVLWTRLDPELAPGIDTVSWHLYRDAGLTDLVRAGSVAVGPGADWTAKVLVGDLEPDRDHWYRFTAGAGADAPASPRGRARTLPVAGADVDRFSVAFGSCQQWPDGWYNAWAGIAAEDVDAVVWLGDYIYESYGTSWPTDVRNDPVGTAEDLEGYRAKYRLYRSDPLLQAGHAAHPFVPIWDDHEFKDNYNRLDLLTDAARATAAYRAWWEYMPVWPIDGDRTFRSLRIGNLAELTLLDTRQYRDPQANGFQAPDVAALGVGPVVVEAGITGRTILGAAQRSWLLDTLDAAQADDVRWKLIGNQVMITPVRPVDLDQPWRREIDPNVPLHDGVFANMDSWDSYLWERDVLLAHLADAQVSDVAFLTGDVHMFWQSTLAADFDDDASPKVANEFVGGGITSQGVQLIESYDVSRALEQSAQTWSPPFRYCDFRRNGYGVLDATPGGMDVTYRVTSIRAIGAPTVSSVRFHLTPGSVDPTVESINP